VIRLASWIILSLLITAAIAWLTSLPGTMTIELLGARMQPRLGVAAFMLLALFVAVIIVWGIVRRIVTAPRFLARRAELRRKEQGVEALSDGYIALEAGDYGRARMLAREARTNLPRNEAAQLLEARADLALGDMSAAREHYRALISNRKTALAALSGLYEQARQQTRP
jgi:HemY protein